MHLLEHCIVITKRVLKESRRMGIRRINVKPLIFSSKNIQETKSHHTAAVNSKCMKVTVLGAAGPTGTALSLLLKQSSLIDELAVYDRSSMAGLVLELSHIDTRCKVNSCTGAAGIVSEANLKEALQDAKIVMITSEDEAFKKITKNQEELLKRNANVISELVPSLMRYCPRAMIALVSRPMNSLIPLISEMYKKGGFDEDTVQTHLFGVTSLDCVRANKFAAEILGIGPECVLVPVIGGSCPKTCIPLFSQMKPSSELTNEEIGKLTYSVKMAEEEVAKEYGRKGSSSLAMAFAAARFCISLCKALRDQRGVVECAYVRSCVIPEVTYFAAPLELGPNGVQKHLGIPALSDYECKMLTATIPVLKVAIRMGQVVLLDPGTWSQRNFYGDVSCPRGSLCQ
ncbi:malate dehydrogenase, mitochondrial isoform X2 [Cephus cinctus]|uniref:Malate dehydrogenase, mitochondrial n=1 Tax=Cephus cinctus TaxID=211228 RepID=A0AAJ7RGW5_CEPCN|nr:malate dehydrogenase, mitochondrial isoform X2 [Cephus cinctus]